MTATIVDDLTDTESDKNRECKGQGMANIASGLLGGMAGCAMIGQSVINVKSGGRGRLSCLVAGVVLLLMVVFLSEWVSQIPMAALVAVMIMVSIGTFSWDSIRNLKQFPLSTNIVMLATVAALDKVVIKLRREGTEVEVIGLNTASATIVDRFAVHDKDNPSDLLSGH